MFMIFYIAENGEVSRSDEISSYQEAIDVAKGGPSGARFEICDISTNEYCSLLVGYVA